MSELSFIQLVDMEQVQRLLEALYKITGTRSAILDTEENVLVAVGWEDICLRFHRVHPVTCANCRESDAYIKSHVGDVSVGYLEYRCKNGLMDVALPIVIGGEHLATLFTGQFFYDDEKPDLEFFRDRAERFGFDTEGYLNALSRVPLCSREHIRNVMDYYGSLVKILGELGLKNLNLTREVKNRKKAEESLQDIINTIADPLFVKDREHRLVLVNDAECALAGHSREEMIGKTDYDFFPKEQVDIFWQQDEIVFETEEVTINEEVITDAQGRIGIFLTKKSLYRLDGNQYLVGIIRDVTDLKEKERELRTINEELELRVAARTTELASLNAKLVKEVDERKKAVEEIRLRQRQLEELNETLERRVEEELAENRAKDIILIQQNRQAALGEMLDHIAHQWKQPINDIALIVQDLELTSSCGKLTDAYLESTSQKTLALLDHMVQTIDVFRDFYRPEKKKTVFSLKDSVDMALSLIGRVLRLRSITVELDVDPGLAALGYPREYAQVLLNLMANAKNALVERGIETPRIKMEAFAEAGKAVVTIADNAGGIPDGDLRRIFEPYYTTRKGAGGTGVGLYMSKNIIENSMGGTLTVANVGDGAQFRIEIPAS